MRARPFPLEYCYSTVKSEWLLLLVNHDRGSPPLVYKPSPFEGDLEGERDDLRLGIDRRFLAVFPNAKDPRGIRVLRSKHPRRFRLLDDTTVVVVIDLQRVGQLCIGRDRIPGAGTAEKNVARVRIEHGVRVDDLGHDLVVDLNQGVPDLAEFVERYRLCLAVVILLVFNRIALFVVGVVVVAALGCRYHEKRHKSHHGKGDSEKLSLI